MISKNIMPFVDIYRDETLDVEKILAIVKKAEDPKYTSPVIEGFDPWMDFGHTCRARASYAEQMRDNPGNSDLMNDHIYVVSKINNILMTCYVDYINRWVDSDKMKTYNELAEKSNGHQTPIFKKHVDDWNIFNKKGDDSGFVETTIDFVKFDAGQKKDYILHYHIDDCDNERSPTPHAIISSTIYLNDDYQNGEVSFINEFYENVIEYKPKAGDITIFPSSFPFFHASRPPIEADKYFARHFLTWKSKGNDEWNELVERYGVSGAYDMHRYLRKAEEQAGIYNRDVVLPNTNYFDRVRYNGIPFFAKEVVRIDGKDL